MGLTYILEIDLARFVGGLTVGRKEKEASEMHVHNVFVSGINHWGGVEIRNTGRKPY